MLSAFPRSLRALLFAMTGLMVSIVLVPVSTQAQSAGTTFTYQGYLEEGGAPAVGSFDLRFILYDSESGGSQVGSPVEQDAVSVTDGVFAVDLDFGPVFGGDLRYLEVAVRSSGSGSYQALSPREALRPAPSAIVAQEALALPGVTVDGSGNVGIGTTTPSSPLTVAGGIESTSGGITFPDGTTQTTAGVGSGSAWQLGGNSGTNPSSGDFLGTSDDAPLELRTDGTRALRLERVTNTNGTTATNVIAGDPINTIADGVTGATISGGGGVVVRLGASDLLPNRVEADFGTVGGGSANTVSGRDATVGGGGGNTASGIVATVGGGAGNIASGTYATVGGGFENRATGSEATVGGGGGNAARGSEATVGGGGGNIASGSSATVGGGFLNTASGSYATVGGGNRNTASGERATVPGGFRSEARGLGSFAAGYYARVKASHDGTFVWSDNSQPSADSLVSTGPNQFLVRATDFIGFNRARPITQREAFGIRATTSGSNFGGMYMEASSSSGQPFYGYATDGNVGPYHYYDPSSNEWVLNVSGTALRVNGAGDLSVTGRLSKGSGSFTIDHPQAPTEKTLSHSFVESPDMMNVYNGNVTLGADGTATIALPDYFEALNTDFRYQLTPIGAPGPNLYVAEEIADNQFRIAGGTAGMRVSWQVTGIRNDPYAQRHRIQVEEDKAPEDRGTYLHPGAYGQPTETP